MNVEGLAGRAAPAYRLARQGGLRRKGIAFGIVGALFCYAAATHEPNKSGGLDQALSEVLEQPFGPFLLAVIALGFVATGCSASPRPATSTADGSGPGAGTPGPGRVRPARALGLNDLLQCRDRLVDLLGLVAMLGPSRT